MGRNKDLRTLIAGLERSTREHEAKIETERARPMPNLERIAGWESEIRSFRERIDRLLRRLRRDW